MKKAILGFVILSIGACTDATRSAIAEYGSSARIVCHSGGKVIYDGCSTGKILSETNSDGWLFRDAETKRLVSVSGECLIDYGSPCPITFTRPANN